MADYYILDRKNLTLFLPFLPSSLQPDAKNGTLLVAGAVADGLAIGAAAFRKAGSDAVLESIAVSPEYQRQGIASGLLRYLSSVLPAFDCFALRASLAPGLPNGSALGKLFEGMGFQAVAGPTMISCPIAVLQTSPLLQPLREKVRDVAPMKDVPKLRLRELSASLLQQGITAAAIDWDTFDPELSFFGLDKKQEISCCVCAVETPEGISVEWIYSAPSGVKHLILAVVALLRVCEDRCPPGTNFSAVLVDGSARKLLERLAGDAVIYTTAKQWRRELLG